MTSDTQTHTQTHLVTSSLLELLIAAKNIQYMGFDFIAPPPPFLPLNFDKESGKINGTTAFIQCIVSILHNICFFTSTGNKNISIELQQVHG